jgi:hypothetical protein
MFQGRIPVGPISSGNQVQSFANQSSLPTAIRDLLAAATWQPVPSWNYLKSVGDNRHNSAVAEKVLPVMCAQLSHKVQNFETDEADQMAPPWTGLSGRRLNKPPIIWRAAVRFLRVNHNRADGTFPMNRLILGQFCGKQLLAASFVRFEC